MKSPSEEGRHLNFEARDGLGVDAQMADFADDGILAGEAANLRTTFAGETNVNVSADIEIIAATIFNNLHTGVIVGGGLLVFDLEERSEHVVAVLRDHMGKFVKESVAVGPTSDLTADAVGFGVAWLGRGRVYGLARRDSSNVFPGSGRALTATPVFCGVVSHFHASCLLCIV